MTDVCHTAARSAAAAALAGVLVAAAGCVSLTGRSVPAVPYAPVQKRTLVAAVPEGSAVAPNVRDQGTLTNADAALPATSAATNTGSVLARVLRSGDRIQVTMFVPPEPGSFASVVDEQGNINLPLIGPFLVAGKTCAECQRQIEKEYIDQKYYKTITVVIVPPESEYTLTGEVQRPGPYPLTRNLTLRQALSRTAYTEYADKVKVFLTRNNSRIEISLEEIKKGVKPDPVIVPGDIIEVPRSVW